MRACTAQLSEIIGAYLQILRKKPSRWALRSTSPSAARIVLMNWCTQMEASAERDCSKSKRLG